MPMVFACLVRACPMVRARCDSPPPRSAVIPPPAATGGPNPSTRSPCDLCARQGSAVPWRALGIHQHRGAARDRAG
jgi:hypothetical protein